MKTNTNGQQILHMSDTELLNLIYVPFVKQFKKTEGTDWGKKYEVFYSKLSSPQRAIFSILNFCEYATQSTGDLYVYSVSFQEYNLWPHLEDAISYFKINKLTGVVQVIQGLLMADQSGRNSLALYAFKQIHTELRLDIGPIHQQIASLVRQHKKAFFCPKVWRVHHRKRSLTA